MGQEQEKWQADTDQAAVDQTASKTVQAADKTVQPPGEKKEAVVRDKSRRKILLFAAVGVALVLLAVVITCVIVFGDSDGKLQEQLDLGAKYLEEMDYEQALVAFDAALEIDPKNVDAYMGLADAYIGLGDKEAAYATLQAGYEATGDERLRDRMEELANSMVADSMVLEEDKEADTALKEEEEELVEFAFDPYEVTLMGYDVFEDHYNEISAAIEALMDRDPIYTPLGSRLYHYPDESTGLYITGSFNDEEKSLDYGNNNTDYNKEPVVEGWSWGIEYDGNSLSGTDNGGFRLNLYPAEGGVYYHPENVVTVPFWPGESYETLNQVMCIDDIKEKGWESEYNDDSLAVYYFKSNLGNGVYHEGIYGEEDRISWHTLEIYYEDGKVFAMSCEITASNQINDCRYYSDMEELGYPAYLWEEPH